MWDIDYSIIEPWLDQQDETAVAHIFSAFEILQQEGPNLGRPLVDSIRGSSIAHLKELRPPSPGNIEYRLLFVFDETRKAIMLVAGDKSKAKSRRRKWSGWYKEAIRTAEQRYAERYGNGGN